MCLLHQRGFIRIQNVIDSLAYAFAWLIYNLVHRCGASASMRACHAAGRGSIPGRDNFPGWGFFGVFPHQSDKCQETLGPQGPRLSFDRRNHHSIFDLLGWLGVCAWCVLSFMFVLSRRWPRHWGGPPCPCVVKKACRPIWSRVNSPSRQVVAL